jgi:tRNA dimethylallyltransferase
VNALVAIVGPTAAGKSALAIAVARAIDGEVVACDSTAVYRGIDIGTDKVPAAAQGGIPHHLVDVVGPMAIYSAADYARDASAVIRAITSRGRVPVLVGGTGFYYRALTRGLFPGPSRDAVLRGRLDRIAAVRGVECLWRWLRRVDPASAARIMPRDQKRIVRALEVYRVSGQPLSAHFARTTSPIPDYTVVTIGLAVDRAHLLPRVTARVDQQLAAGVVDEVRRLMAAGVPVSAHALSGLVYRQVVEHLAGVRDLAATRELIVRENMRYARRQVSWFRKEPAVRWVEGPGERPEVVARVINLVRGQLWPERSRLSEDAAVVGQPEAARVGEV